MNVDSLLFYETKSAELAFDYLTFREASILYVRSPIPLCPN